MTQWLQGIVGASLLSSLALLLCPGGAVKQVTRLVCAMVCALAVILPVKELDPDSLGLGMEEYRRQAEILAQQEEEQAKMVTRTYIQEECRTYILSQAQELALSAGEVSVLARWDAEQSVWYPWEVSLGSPYSKALASVIEEHLGIPEERQHWTQ